MTIYGRQHRGETGIPGFPGDLQSEHEAVVSAQEERSAERLRHDGSGVVSWPVVTRRTREEIEADFIIRSSVCGYCGHREVAEDNECSQCGVKRVPKRFAS